mmetsp:Transcript_22460/g.53017  ORF Transcript_22460/g.53017 Transcript_22460/m.53017 type:complete len:337 (+) Transcript_22460:157-1167(+)
MAKNNKIAALLLLVGTVSAIQDLRFASPLQSLTIPDPEVLEKVPDSSLPADSEEVPKIQRAMCTPRKQFLKRFTQGLRAEKTAREKLALGMVSVEDEAFDASGKDWVNRAKTADEKRRRKENAYVESAHDAAVAKYDAALAKSTEYPQNPNKYQFVGLVDRNNKEKPVSWHARPKPENSKWSVRLVHVNKDTIIKDLFDRGKIDIFAKYTNTGRQVETVEKGEDGTTVTKKTNIPIVTTKYEVRERSLKNLYNFSIKHFFTDSSGAYWRERRLRPGMYTDGESVYETSYRYRDGRNGMHRVGSLQQFLASSSVDTKEKDKILKKLKEAAPDIVLEL